MPVSLSIALLTDLRPQRKRAQDSFVDRLLALLQKKADVEKQIITHVQELAEAYEVVKGEFETVLKGRSEDVHEAIKALHELEEKGSASPNAHH